MRRGYWFYAGTLRKTVMIHRLNYDVYYELEKDDGIDVSDETPRLNEDSYSYLVIWPEENSLSRQAPGQFHPMTEVFLLREQ